MVADFFKEHMPALAGFASLVMTVILALLSKTYARKEEVDDLKMKFSHMEAKLDSLPTVEQFHRVEMGVAELSGDVKEMKSAMKAIGNTTQLLLETHLKESDK